MKNLILAVLTTLTLATSARADVPEGSFGGTSPRLSGPDIMGFLIRKDPADPRQGYALLAEYTRLPYIPGPERLEITKWIPRMYAYKVEQTGEKTFAMKPIRVSAGGGIEVDGGYANFGTLTLGRRGMLDATLTRYEKGSVMIAETISLRHRISSTWEAYVPGDYFGTRDSTGGDYTSDAVNTVLRADKTATFTQEKVQGEFDIAEKAPGIFVFTPRGQVIGAEQVAGRIGVFVDIVNWKPFFTTDELLLINPDDAKDLGFYYERH